ncbi:hypothetical protein K3727_00030 [Rhodobacteraceae bacterium M382]|nr:hypothetical protein K3727_00030 [Rhodobacteraceae bacterium M382]
MPNPTDSEIRFALSRVLGSEALRNSDRSKEFLTYVVEQSLAGQAKSIKGKTIAADVFGRDPSEVDSDNVVRVEARRVRRKLSDYYTDEGASDAVRIHIDSGGYAPRFEMLETMEDEPDIFKLTPRQSYVGAIVVALIVALMGGGVLTMWMARSTLSPSAVSDTVAGTERKALREKSLSTLQAANLDVQGRNLLFPITDPKRQILALSLFEEAIALDPEYFGGYASAAHSIGTLALLSAEGPRQQTLLTRATEMSQRALELAPQEAWAHAARAWAHLAGRDFDTAIKAAQLAEEMDPKDSSVLDTYGMVMFMTGHFDEASAASDPNRKRHGDGQRLVRHNIRGVASFHLSQFEDAIDAFETAIQEGAPVSPPTLVFMAASYEGLGRLEEAKKTVAELRETYPEFRPDLVFPRFYRDPLHATAVLDAIGRVGWSID